MNPLFTVRWPAFARIEAILIFIAIIAFCIKIPELQSFLANFSFAKTSIFGASEATLRWGAITFLAAGPYIGVMIAADRMLATPYGFACLSILAVAIWAGLAAMLSAEIAALLPATWTGGSPLMSFTGEAAVAVASIALLIHAKPLWVGLADQNMAGLTLVQSGASAEWQPPDAWIPHASQNPTARKTIGGPVSSLLWTASVLALIFMFKSNLPFHAAEKPVASPRTSGPGEAEAWRMRNGSFIFAATINDQPTSMLFDTGASWVTLRSEDAARLGIAKEKLNYTVQARTANGTAWLARIVIDTITVGSITMRDIPAVVAQPGVLHDNLLGQTFLARLRDFKVQGDRVILDGN